MCCSEPARAARERPPNRLLMLPISRTAASLWVDADAYRLLLVIFKVARVNTSQINPAPGRGDGQFAYRATVRPAPNARHSRRRMGRAGNATFVGMPSLMRADHGSFDDRLSASSVRQAQAPGTSSARAA
jgi:hypothetical protein